MTACRTLIHASLSSIYGSFRGSRSVPSSTFCCSVLEPLPFPPRLSTGFLGFWSNGRSPLSKSYSSESLTDPLEATSDSSEDNVEELLTKGDRIERLMKMERRSDDFYEEQSRWFPYLDLFHAGPSSLSSCEVIEALDPYILEARKERMRRAVKSRTYSVCLVVEGLTDFGNVSAAFRSADALGIQSVHVISTNSRKRCTYH